MLAELGIAMEDDVFDDDDRVVDDESHGCSQAAECHQVEALADGAECDEGYGNRYWNH